MVHEDYKELLSAKALTALAAEDARLLDSHLETCAECRAELIEWEQTVALLALDVDADADGLEPSVALRGKILANVRRSTAENLRQNRTTSATEPAVDLGESKVLPFARRSTLPSSPGWGFGAIAAGLVIVALLISLFVLWQQNRKAQFELARFSTQMEEARTQLSRQREAMELLTSPGARMASLSGTNMAPTANAMIAYDKTGHAMLMAKGLPAAPRGMAYQLWFIVGNKPMPGKTLTVDEAGSGTLTDELPQEALGSAVFAITLEPAGGVQAPTGKMYLTSG